MFKYVNEDVKGAEMGQSLKRRYNNKNRATLKYIVDNN